MENENTYYLLGYDQDVLEETLILLAEGEKHPEHPITTNVMELVPWVTCHPIYVYIVVPYSKME